MKTLKNLFWGQWIKGKSAEPVTPKMSEQELVKMLEDIWQVGPDRARFWRHFEGDFGRIDVTYTPCGEPPAWEERKPKRKRRKS